jgi:hypothetical protein
MDRKIPGTCGYGLGVVHPEDTWDRLMGKFFDYAAAPLGFISGVALFYVITYVVHLF